MEYVTFIITVLFGLCLCLSNIEGAKILAIFPFPGPSQYILVQPYLKTLAARGHNVTVINAFPQKKPIENFRDIPVLEVFEDYDNIVNSIQTDLNKWQEFNFYTEFFESICIRVLNNKAVQKLINSDEEKFDLVIVETVRSEILYGFAQHFGAPLIGFSSFGTDVEMDEYVGNVSPISYVPSTMSDLTTQMNFIQRLKNFLIVGLQYLHTYTVHLPRQKVLYNKYFPNAKVSLETQRRNFSLMLLNQHFSLSFPRPYVPNMIQVGGFHISHKPSSLPTDMADFINGAENGVIYFSMGSNIKSEKLPKETIDVFLKTFASLPQRVLWKFEAETLPGKPDNVFISKWFPQPDILAHPKVKLFITHGGLLSTMEAIYHAKPIIGIPNFFDQFLNVANAVKSGYALDVDINSISIASFGAKIKKILSDQIYTEKIKKISRQYHDQPIKPIDAAIYWTEYVLRHEGAKHMRVAGQDLNFMEVHSFDVIGVLVFVSAVGLWVVYWFVSKILGYIFTSNAIKHKRE